jgi:hypothetical protein
MAFTKTLCERRKLERVAIMKTSNLILFFLLFGLLRQSFADGGGSTVLGELRIDIRPVITKTITVEAVGTVWGSKDLGYPVTHAYDYYQTTGYGNTWQFVDDAGQSDNLIIGYGEYAITIDGNAFIVDYRDCDYSGKSIGVYSCHNPDIIVEYNSNNGSFSVTSQPSSPNIWAKRCDGGGPRQNCFQESTPQPPPAPQNLIITNFGQYGQNPNLCWNASAGATSYNLYRRFGVDPYWMPIGGSITSTSYTDLSVTMLSQSDPGADQWFYQVTAVNSGEESAPSNSVSTWGSGIYKTTSGRDEIIFGEMNNIPEHFRLEQNYPNPYGRLPFNPETELRYALPRPGYVELVIANLLGQPIRRLVAKNQPAGWHSKIWNGRDEQSKQVASGIYLYRLSVQPQDGNPRFTEARKLSLLR